MGKRKLLVMLIGMMLLSACGKNSSNQPEEISQVVETESQVSFDIQKISDDMIKASYSLERSNIFSLKSGLRVTAMGVYSRTFPTGFNETYLLPAIEAKTGIHFDIDWKEESCYATAVATTMLKNKDLLPDLISPRNFGVMDLADDGLIVPLDEYLYLMPDIVAAVGEDYLDEWRAADGHIYTIPSVSTIRSSYSSMIRKDWLDELGMEVPESWSEWKAYWEGVANNDLNHNGDPHDEIPIVCASGENGERTLVPLLNAFGIKVSQDGQFCTLDDGTYTMIYEHPRYKYFLEEMADLYEKGIITTGYETYSEIDVEDMMANNIAGSAFSYIAHMVSASADLTGSGAGEALWISVKPVAGPFGDRLIPEHRAISDSWCITIAAKNEDKVEDMVRFFNWCFTEEGSYILNYGIEGISYDIVDGKPKYKQKLVQNGFKDIVGMGIFCEPFGGLWLEEQYLQCLFSGKEEKDFNEIQKEIYRGLFETNTHYTYPMVKIL